jgi:hypothetical protein
MVLVAAAGATAAPVPPEDRSVSWDVPDELPRRPEIDTTDIPSNRISLLWKRFNTERRIRVSRTVFSVFRSLSDGDFHSARRQPPVMWSLFAVATFGFFVLLFFWVTENLLKTKTGELYATLGPDPPPAAKRELNAYLLRYLHALANSARRPPPDQLPTMQKQATALEARIARFATARVKAGMMAAQALRDIAQLEAAMRLTEAQLADADLAGKTTRANILKRRRRSEQQRMAKLQRLLSKYEAQAAEAAREMELAQQTLAAKRAEIDEAQQRKAEREAARRQAKRNKAAGEDRVGGAGDGAAAGRGRRLADAQDPGTRGGSVAGVSDVGQASTQKRRGRPRRGDMTDTTKSMAHWLPAAAEPRPILQWRKAQRMLGDAAVFLPKALQHGFASFSQISRLAAPSLRLSGGGRATVIHR